MFSHNERISIRQVTVLLILQMFNTGMLILPKLATEFVDRNGYVLPILAVILGSIYIFCITKLTNMFSQDTMVEFLPKIFPKFIANVIMFVFALKIIISTGLELRMFGEMVGLVMLPKTPIIIIILIMLLTVAYLVKSGVEAMARMAEILIYFVFLPLVIAFWGVVQQADYRQIMPFFQTDIESLGWGAYYISLSFMPIEFMLMTSGLMKNTQKARKSMFIAVIVIAILQDIMILLTYTGIGVEETQRQIWPVLTLMQSIQSTESIIGNREIFMMSGWIFSIFMYISSGLYFTSLIGTRSFGFKRENIFVLPLVPIVYFISIWPQGLVETYDYYIRFQRDFGIWFLVPVPLALFLIAKGRGISYEK